MSAQSPGYFQRSLLSLAIIGHTLIYSSSVYATTVIHESKTMAHHIHAGPQDDAALIVGSEGVGHSPEEL
ncbi:hypothetical protein CI610_02606 [invertebrate metagenome]|uniref:Uncharacterized protein n=1 Tax=invertebrate metagenome TaxID=1711999 RepID=A0A2H9T5G6_9ZZZZ